jgi:hypothetical protein
MLLAMSVDNVTQEPAILSPWDRQTSSLYPAKGSPHLLAGYVGMDYY